MRNARCVRRMVAFDGAWDARSTMIHLRGGGLAAPPARVSTRASAPPSGGGSHTMKESSYKYPTNGAVESACTLSCGHPSTGSVETGPRLAITLLCCSLCSPEQSGRC